MELHWKIQSTYLKVYDYITAVKNLPSETGQVYKLVKSTLDSEDVCFPNASLLPGRFSNFMFNPIADFDRLLAHLNSLKDFQVERLIGQALDCCIAVLPSSPGVLCILPGGHPDAPDINRFLRTTGVVADATSTVIRLYISPVNDWHTWLKPIVAHEYNHYVRLQKYDKVKTLRDYLVLEGLAEAFSREVSPDVVTPYTEDDFITHEQSERVWSIMLPNLEAKEALDKHMFGEDRAYSFLSDEQKATIGYPIGYRIVRNCIDQRYIKKSTNVDWEELTFLESETILSDSSWVLVN